ncbi:MAG: DUF86 domain-containing protein [Chloroflexi bacterium]|nr:DUF86 domain-containing protein [Chloroflexota bacterium]
MNNPPKKLLFDIRAACDELQSFLVDVTRDDYRTNRLLRRGVERDLEIIGEALAQLRVANPSTFERIPAGAQIVAMRHRLIHGYAQVSDDIVWDTVQRDITPLRQAVQALLDA